jgi:ligand-binding sensor domain-containing protein
MMVLRRIFQDSQKNIWFVGDDVYCLKDDSLINFSDYDVFDRIVTRHVAEDKEGNIWFGTSDGIVKFNPSVNADSAAFTKFTKEEGLAGRDVWSMKIDQNGIIWIGTLEGVSQFNPLTNTFSPFDLPESEPDPTRGVTSAKIVHSITEDGQGNIWFGTNSGAYYYNPASDQKGEKSLFHISEQDGLCNNVVNDILEDKLGNIWFATHHAGVCRWNRNQETENDLSFTHITAAEGIEGTEAWSLNKDRSGHIWFPIEHEGIYRYNVEKASLTHFTKKDGLMMNNVHCVIEDTKGRFWLGGFGGLYRYDPSVEQAGEKPFRNLIEAESPWNDQ